MACGGLRVLPLLQAIALACTCLGSGACVGHVGLGTILPHDSKTAGPVTTLDVQVDPPLIEGFGGWGDLDMSSLRTEVPRGVEKGAGLQVAAGGDTDLLTQVTVKTSDATTTGQKLLTGALIILTLDIYPLLGGPFPTTTEWEIEAKVTPRGAPGMVRTYTRQGKSEDWSSMYVQPDGPAESLSEALTAGLQEVCDEIEGDVDGIRMDVAKARRARAPIGPDVAARPREPPVPEPVAEPIPDWPLKWSAGTKVESGDRFAVLVTADRYKSYPSWEIPSCRRNGEEIKAALKSHCGIPEGGVDWLRGENANAVAVQAAIRDVGRRATGKRALLVIYYAGHGWVDGDRQPCLFTHYTTESPSGGFEQVVRRSELLEWLGAAVRQSESRGCDLEAVLVVDACRVGSAAPPQVARLVKSDLWEVYGTREGRFAQVGSGDEPFPFTRGLVSSIQALARLGKEVDLARVFQEARNRTLQATNRRQDPELLAPDRPPPPHGGRRHTPRRGSSVRHPRRGGPTRARRKNGAASGRSGGGEGDEGSAPADRRGGGVPDAT
jgi:hypothetical protein